MLREFKVPLPIRVIVLLAAGLAAGLLYPNNATVKLLYASGTILPRTIVTFAVFFIFHLLAAAMAKLMLSHKERAGKMFGLILSMYVTMGAISLVWATAWLALLSHLPFSSPGAIVPGPFAWAAQIGRTFGHMLSEQPLLQALVGAMAAGWVSAKVRSLHRVAYGLIAVGDLILVLFRKLLWYYPIMIGCLAIGIPLKFGSKGIGLYATGVLWDVVVVGSWSLCTILFCKLFTRRTWEQILSYYGTVWPTGFGTGGSYDTLAVNIVSAEGDLGLKPEVAEVSIVFGTVLNKNCATMSLLIVTIVVARLLSVPISMLQIVMMLPPVMILGLESPGIPGGAAYFMSPIVAALLQVPDQGAWIATFVACYSGLIPMISAAGNTTNDGVVGAVLQDRFENVLGMAADRTSLTAGIKG